MYEPLIRPLLFRLDSEWVHDRAVDARLRVSVAGLALYGAQIHPR